jgi:ABC-type nitrate/sulfonate/bicarbonate transport system substrate-binding protein
MPPSFRPVGRRQFLIGAGALTGVALVPGLLTACGSSSSGSATDSSAGGGGDFGGTAFQINWIPDATYSGIYLADQNGYFTDAGFSSVDVLPGGADISPAPVVAGGQALVGIANAVSVAAANQEGADLVVIGTTFQKNPYLVLSLPGSPLRTPNDLIGKTVALDAVNQPVWEAFLTANGIEVGAVKTVPANYDLSLLTNGSVDGYMGYVTNEPGALELQGITPVELSFDDFGLPSVDEVLVTTKSAAGSKAEEVKAVLAAILRGYQDFVGDPAAGAALTIERYGTSAGLDDQVQGLVAQNVAAIMVTPEVKESGLLTISADRQALTLATLEKGGTAADAGLFDLTLLEQVLASEPTLSSVPA